MFTSFVDKYYISYVVLQTYLRFIWGHTIVYFLSNVHMSLVRSEIFDIMLVSEALIWVYLWGRSSSHKFYPPYGVADFWTGIFIFTGCVVQHLVYSISMAYHPYIIWTPWGSERFSCTLYLVGPSSAPGVYPLYVFLFTGFWEWYTNWSKEMSVLHLFMGSAHFWGFPQFMAWIQMFWRI